MKQFFSWKKKEAARPYPWRLFAFYSIIGIAAALSILPYLLTLLDISGNPLPVPLTQIVLEQIVQSAIVLLPMIGVGLLLAERVKLDSPYLRALLYRKKMPDGFPRVLALSVGLGFLASIVIAVTDLALIRDEVLSNIQQIASIPVMWRILTAFYGGIDEEILMRLFLLTFIAWLTWLVRRNKDGSATNTGMWIAVAISTIIFGLSHLPITSTLTTIDMTVALRALLLNGIGGAIFGWLYWKKGFEAAIISHFSADITLQVIVPTVIAAVA